MYITQDKDIIRLKETFDRLFKATVAFNGAIAGEVVFSRSVAEEMYRASTGILSELQKFFSNLTYNNAAEAAQSKETEMTNAPAKKDEAPAEEVAPKVATPKKATAKKAPAKKVAEKKAPAKKTAAKKAPAKKVAAKKA